MQLLQCTLFIVNFFQPDCIDFANELKKWKYQMLALPYIREDDMIPECNNAWTTFQMYIKTELDEKFLLENAAIWKQVQRFHDYLADNWMKDEILSEFNCFEKLNRTDNPLESVHKQMNKNIQRNPNATQFVSKYNQCNSSISITF